MRRGRTGRTTKPIRLGTGVDEDNHRLLREELRTKFIISGDASRHSRPEDEGALQAEDEEREFEEVPPEVQGRGSLLSCKEDHRR